MLKYCLKRLVLAVVTLFVIMAITFFAMNAIPGGPFDSEKAPTPEVKAVLMERYNLKQEEEKEKDPDPKYHRGQVLWLGFPTSQNYMEVIILEVESYVKGKGWRYLVNGVQYGGKHSFYLETQEYVHPSDPGPIWIG